MNRRLFLKKTLLGLTVPGHFMEITGHILAEKKSSLAPDVIIKAVRDHQIFVDRFDIPVFKRLKFADWWALTMSICEAESDFDPEAVNHTGKGEMIGLMQVNYTYWSKRFLKGRSRDFLFNPYWNIRVGLAIFSSDLARTGTIRKALYSYVGGKDHRYVTRVLERAFWLKTV